MKEYPNIGDKVILKESYKKHPYYEEFYFENRTRLDNLMGKPVEVEGIGKLWGDEYLEYCDITDGEICFRVPLEFVEATE